MKLFSHEEALLVITSAMNIIASLAGITFVALSLSFELQGDIRAAIEVVAIACFVLIAIFQLSALSVCVNAKSRSQN